MTDNGTNGTEMTVGRRLQVLRAILNKTQYAVSQDLGCDRALITRWEAGSHPIPEARLDQIKELYGVDLNSPQWISESLELVT